MISRNSPDTKLDSNTDRHLAPNANPAPQLSPGVLAHNLRRLMAQLGMTYEDVVAATGLDSRTIRGVIQGSQTPQARTLYRLAQGMGVATNDLFAPPQRLTPEAFDSATNPAVELLREHYPDVLANWSLKQYTELTSKFGIGGELTLEGALAEAEAINMRRSVLMQAQIVLQSSEAELLTDLIEVLYKRVHLSQ